MTPIIISIEGNIGSGKSTLVEELRQSTCSGRSKLVFVDEPVSEWDNIRDKSGETMLSKFYANQREYAFSFQMMAYISRVSALRQAVRDHPNSIIITERSVQTDKNVFAKMLYDQGLIREVDYQIYLKWFDEFVMDLPITGLIYVKTDPITCQRRVETRNRTGESISLEYLTRCDNYHQHWINNFSTERICEIDGNMDIRSDSSVLSQWVSQILTFIQPDICVASAT
jgi:deoxyadenosine/deoxycytidine kinase